jgi:hypothetical protein
LKKMAKIFSGGLSGPEAAALLSVPWKGHVSALSEQSGMT